MQQYLVVVVSHDPCPTEDDRRQIGDLSSELLKIPSDQNMEFIFEKTWAGNVEELVIQRGGTSFPNPPQVTLIFTSSRDLKLAKRLRHRYGWQIILLTASIPPSEITIISKWPWMRCDTSVLKILITYS